MSDDNEEVEFREMTLIVCSDGTKSKMYDKVWQPEKEVVEGDDVIFVSLNGKTGLINYFFDELCPPKYDNAFQFYNGYACVELNGLYGFIDKSGNEICQIKYDNVWAFSEEGVALVSKDGKYGFIDTEGNEVCPVKYHIGGYIAGSVTDTNAFHDYVGFNIQNLTVITDENGKQGFVNRFGQVIVEPQYDSVRLSYDIGIDGRYIPFENDGKMGYLSCDGSIAMKADYYDEVDHFHNGYACVMIDENRGFINLDFQPICDLEYVTAFSFYNGDGAFVEKVSKKGPLQITISGYINSDGVLYQITRREFRIGRFCIRLKF